MPVPFSGDMLNAPPVTPSLAGELNTFNRSAPSMGQVAGAFVSDVYQGNGSTAQDVQRVDFNNALDTQNPISPEDWKASPNYREGLQYYPGMTDKAAEILAQNNDDKNAREYVMSKASGLQTIAGFGAALGAGLFEPKNLASGIAAGAITEGLGVVVPSIKRVFAIGGELGRYKSLAIAGATEGGLATALTEPSNRESAKIMQNDYTMADSLLNFGLSTVLGGAMHAGIGKFKDVRAAKLADEGIKVASDIPEVRAKEFDAGLAQMTEGRQVDVEHVGEIDKAQTAIEAQNDLPKIDEQINAAQTEMGIRSVTESPEFKSWFGDSQILDDKGEPKTLYHGTDQAFDSFDISKSERNIFGEGVYASDNPEVAAQYIKGTEGENIIPLYASIEKPFVVDGTKPSVDINKNELVKQGYDGVIINHGTGDSTYVAFKPEQVKSVFNRGVFDSKDPRLHDVQTLEQMQVKKRQAEANSQLVADKEPVTRTINDATKPDNSTAYSPKDLKDVSDYLDQFGHEDDRAALENSLQMAQEDIQAMKDEGMLSGEQLAILDKLTEIDDGINLHDNILRSAFLCLTRG